MIRNHRKGHNETAHKSQREILHQKLLRCDVDENISEVLAHIGEYRHQFRGNAQASHKANQKDNHADQNPIAQLLQVAGYAHTAVG